MKRNNLKKYILSAIMLIVFETVGPHKIPCF